MRKQPKRIGLAIVGAGRVGLFRGEVAARHPQVDWIGVADLKRERAKLVGDKCGADFVDRRPFPTEIDIGKVPSAADSANRNQLQLRRGNGKIL